MANEAIDWSRYMEGLQGKANTDNTNLTGKADGVIDYQVNPDGSWYRQWKSGWLEQGGEIKRLEKGSNFINFQKQFKDTLYNVNVTRKAGGTTNNYIRVSTRGATPTSVDLYNQDDWSYFTWYACGMGGV